MIQKDLLKTLKSARQRISPCTPPLWARSGHAQTLLGHLIPSRAPRLKGETLSVTLESPEERIITTHVAGHRPMVVYLFHGLSGSTEAGYMRRTAQMARKLGCSVFLNNHRGCGEGFGLASEPYHSGRAEDLSAVIEFGRKRYPDHLHVAIGFSLSANALLLLAAGVRAEVMPDVAIAVNGPIHLDEASKRLTEGLNRIYDVNFVRELKAHVKRNARKAGRSAPALKRVKSLRDFDEAYTARAGGFRNRDHYYGTCSSMPFLNQIRIPTVLLTAEDDPFIEPLHYRNASLSAEVLLHLERHGGHLGYLDRRKGRWLDSALETYLTALSDIL